MHLGGCGFFQTFATSPVLDKKISRLCLLQKCFWEGIMEESENGTSYWKANIRLVTRLMVIWALVSFGFGILLRPLLSGIPIGGTDLGFWFAQQGSILVFLVLIFYYAWRMNKLDREFNVDEQ